MACLCGQVGRNFKKTACSVPLVTRRRGASERTKYPSGSGPYSKRNRIPSQGVVLFTVE